MSQPASPQFFQSRMGKQTSLVWPLAQRVFGPGVAQRIQSCAYPILEVDLAKALCNTPERQYDAGSWVLTLDHTAIYDTPVLPNQLRICPTRALVDIGSGGTTQVVECDTKNQSFQVAASVIRVTVDWDNELPANNTDPGVLDYVTPVSVVIRANLQRSFSQGRATRTQWLPQWSIPGPASVFNTGVVPNFARCVRLWGERNQLDPLPNGAQFFSGPNYGDLIFFPEELTTLPLIRYRGPNLLDPSGVPVPVLAQRWQMSIPELTVPGVCLALEYDLNL